MAVDQLGLRGVEVEPPSSATLSRLSQAGLPCAPGRVLDLTLAGTKYEIMRGALDILLGAPEFDLVLAVVGSSARFQPHLAVRPIIECATESKPLAAWLVPDAPDALAALTAAGVPCFRTPEACADSIAAVFARRDLAPGSAPPRQGGSAAGAISEADSYGVLGEIGLPYAPYVLRRFDEPAVAIPFGFPVVAKVCSPGIPHKTDVGGVFLDIDDHAQLAEAIGTLRANARERCPHTACEEVLIQKMYRAIGEVLVGYRWDAEAGPIVMLAAGGIWAEVVKDRSVRLAPVSVETAREMIEEVKALKPLSGLRGTARADLEGLARAVSALSRLAVRPELGVAEAEVNPLLILPEGKGVLAVDALVVLA